MAWGRRAHGALIYTRARVTAGDDGEASAVLRRLGRCTYGWHRGRTGGPPHVRRRGGEVRGVLGHRRASVCVGLGLRSRQEGARARPSRVGQRRRATLRRGGARPDTILLGLPLKLNLSKNLNTTHPKFEYESYTSSYPLPFSKRLYGVFLHRF
jgi:hypothetical protein